MISKQHFRKNKKGGVIKNVTYCLTPELIENYEKAINDTAQIWICHHRAEICYTREELIKKGDYYNVPPQNLIFLTPKEHTYLHSRITSNSRCKGKHWKNSKETVEKRISFLKGKKFSQEHKKRLSESAKNRTLNRKGPKGKHWYNNGKECIMAFDCPPGFVPGRIKY